MIVPLSNYDRARVVKAAPLVPGNQWPSRKVIQTGWKGSTYSSPVSSFVDSHSFRVFIYEIAAAIHHFYAYLIRALRGQFRFILFFLFHSNSIPSPLPSHTNQLEIIERGKRTISRSNYRGCWCCFFGDVFGTKKGDLQRFYEAARLRKNASWCRIIECREGEAKKSLSLFLSSLLREEKKTWKQGSTRDGILINMKTTTTVPVMPETGWS